MLAGMDTDNARFRGQARSSVRWRRVLATVAPSLAALLAFAPAAFGAGDPVRVGSFQLKLSQAFKNQLSRHGVAITPKSFAIKGGSIDPITGAGSLTLSGKLRFKHGHKKVVYGHLNATLGPAGALRGGKTKLFSLHGGTVTRNGFGADIGGVDLNFLKSAARKLRKALDLNALRSGDAGSLAVSEQPQTVEVLSGTASVEPALGPGSISSKLAAHCVDPNTGVSVIAPGTQPGGPGTTIFFPVTFGTISPAGLDGVIQQAGGIQLANGGPGLPSGCPASNNFTIRLSDLSVDLLNRSVSAHVTLSGPGSPFGDLDAQISFPIDISDAWLNPDFQRFVVTTNGTVIRLNSSAAYLLNFVLPQPSPGDPSMQFADGDAFGTAGVTVQVR
ncbi:MAG: hypothetical protein AABM43_04725 [Actinomycetota bacterium]